MVGLHHHLFRYIMVIRLNGGVHTYNRSVLTSTLSNFLTWSTPREPIPLWEPIYMYNCWLLSRWTSIIVNLRRILFYLCAIFIISNKKCKPEILVRKIYPQKLDKSPPDISPPDKSPPDIRPLIMNSTSNLYIGIFAHILDLLYCYLWVYIIFGT